MKVPVEVQSGTFTKTFTVDETQPLPAGGAFRSVGVVTLDAGAESIITLSNTGTEGFVILDALQLVRVAD